uniref:Disease resistance protein At4g27190-like leucine-rich repeats domain-containing protein n=1 Tax=Populus alba TaxID=43335 RepID=A0A4U5Q9U3_POPAL|nr:hypothetical protein D5086_0000120990 [Populus alba]
MEQLDEQKNAYACLKLSYDYLKHEKTKLCFLLCCLFPEDYNIPIEDLTIYAVGYGLHQDGESIEDARKRVYVAIKNLKACSMLLGTETEEYVKMHDPVRDVAIQIASSEKYGFMVKAGFGLKEWPMRNKSFEGFKVISLMGNKLAELPEGLVCPQLKVLLLELDEDLNVPERFFEGMKAIEVLSLEGGCLSLQSLQFSTNLQSLLLRWCECKDLICLRKLQRLEILVFRWCDSIEELPDEIGELKELRLLDLTLCRDLRRIPVNLIGRLKKLEELLIGDRSFKGWDVVGCDSTEGMNASLTELNSLSHLAVLSLKIPKVECISRDFVFPRLLKYDIVLGNGYSIRQYPTSTRLYLDDLQSLTRLELSCLDKLTFIFTPSLAQSLIHLETLWIFKCNGLSRLIREEDGEREIIPESLGFPKLKTLLISLCEKLEHVFPVSVSPSLQNLEEMVIDFFGPKDFAAQLPSLQCLSISGLEEWGNLLAQLQGLMNLKEISIGNLEGVQDLMQVGRLVTNRRGGHELSLVSLETLHLSLLPDLRCIWKGLVPSNLTTLKVNECKRLTHVFTSNIIASLVQLEVLEISNCEELEQIVAKDNDDEKDQILSGSDLQSSCFPNLYRLEITGCNKSKSLFPIAMASGLKKLQNLEVRESSQLLGVFGQDDHASLVNVEKEIMLPNLEQLFLEKLPSIIYFSHGCYDFIFPHFLALEVRHCPKLTTKFATTSNGSMSAQSEESQVAEGSSTGCSVPTSTARRWTRINGWEEEEDEGGHDDLVR